MYSTANFDVVCDRELFVIRWRAPTPEAFDELAAMLRARHKEVGNLFYVAIVGTDTPPLDGATREALMHSLESTYGQMRMIRVVLIGSGLRLTLVRSLVTALTLAEGLRGLQFYVDKTIQETAAVIAKQLGHEAEQTIEWLLAEGIVLPAEIG